MKIRKVVAIVIGVIVILNLLLVAFFFLTTQMAEPQSITLTTPTTKAQEVFTPPIELSKYTKENILIINEENYELQVDGLKRTLVESELNNAILANQKAINNRVLYIVRKPKTAYKNIVNCLDAMAIAKIKKYELVSEK